MPKLISILPKQSLEYVQVSVLLLTLPTLKLNDHGTCNVAAPEERKAAATAREADGGGGKEGAARNVVKAKVERYKERVACSP